MQDIKELSYLIYNLKSDDEIYKFLREILTENELLTLSKRWRILKMLNDGIAQRTIADELNVSLCKITRGAKVLKNKNAVTTKNLIKEKINDKHST